MNEVEIEGVGSVRRVVVPPVRVPLPLDVWPARGRTIALGLVLGLVCPPFTVLCLWALAIVPETSDPSAAKACVIVALLVAAQGGFIFSAAAFTCIVDGLRQGPALKISAEGLEDARAGVFIPWTSISEVMFTRKGGGVDLRLRLPMPHRQHIFRLGVLGYQYRRDPSRLVVAVTLLDQPWWLVGSVIRKMASLNGATLPTYKLDWFSRPFATDARKRR